MKKIGGRRPGAGRPRTVGGKKAVSMGVVMGDDLKHDIKLAAGEFGITEGELIRRAVRFALRHKQQVVIIPGKGERHA